MNTLTIAANLIPAMTKEQHDFVSEVEQHIKENLQIVMCCTQHTLHDGIYSRTVFIPKGTIVTGVLIKVPTTIIISGVVSIYIGDAIKHVEGYSVVTAAANRKQVVYANEDSYVTLVFPTEAKTIKEAEEAMTDESSNLQSRLESSVNLITITGE